MPTGYFSGDASHESGHAPAHTGHNEKTGGMNDEKGNAETVPVLRAEAHNHY